MGLGISIVIAPDGILVNPDSNIKDDNAEIVDINECNVSVSDAVLNLTYAVVLGHNNYGNWTFDFAMGTVDQEYTNADYDDFSIGLSDVYPSSYDFYSCNYYPDLDYYVGSGHYQGDGSFTMVVDEAYGFIRYFHWTEIESTILTSELNLIAASIEIF